MHDSASTTAAEPRRPRKASKIARPTPADDEVRDAILRHLYDVHRAAKGPKKVAVGILDLRRAMKAQHGFAQNEVVSNLDYLVQKEWVTEVVEQRSYRAPGGTMQAAPKVTYKISHLGIDRMQKASLYQRPVGAGINITNVHGVTVVGENNVVNTHFTDLSRVLSDMRTAVQSATALPDAKKLDLVSDIDSLQTQLQKPEPNRSVIKTLWSGIENAVTGAGFIDLVARAGALIAPLLGNE